jgi:hypothetical protein
MCAVGAFTRTPITALMECWATGPLSRSARRATGSVVLEDVVPQIIAGGIAVLLLALFKPEPGCVFEQGKAYKRVWSAESVGELRFG